MKNRRYSILRNVDLGDCTAHGLSSKVTSVILFWDCSREEAINYCYEKNINPELQMYLNKRDLWGEDHSYAEPLVKPVGKNQVFGGNFIYTSDSGSYHFGNEKCVRPIPVHDRFEEWG